MRELDPLRRLAPPVEPLAPDAVARIRARALAPRRRRLPAAGLLAPVAVAAAAALFVVLGAGGADREVPATSPHANAAAAPRLLLPGWSVTRVDEWKADTGEMTLRQDARELELSWMPAPVAEGMGDKLGARSEVRAQVAGAEAALWRMTGSDDYVAVWRDGRLTVSARGQAESPAAFAAVLGALEPVDEETWRRALPQRAVTPAERNDAVRAMLGEVPLPPGVDLTRLAATTRDRYQLGAHVAGTLACGWIGVWLEAKASGDEALRNRAESVLAGARDWPVLREMDAEGDYPEVLWRYADAVVAGGTVPGGKPLTVAESYEAALCP